MKADVREEGGEGVRLGAGERCGASVAFFFFIFETEKFRLGATNGEYLHDFKRGEGDAYALNIALNNTSRHKLRHHFQHFL